MHVNGSELTTHVLLVDDQEIVRVGCEEAFRACDDITAVGEAQTTDEGYRKFCELEPDVVVLEPVMHGISGLELARRILKRDRRARMLAFTNSENPAYLSQAVMNGFSGYVSKRSGIEELVSAVRRVSRGEFVVCKQLTKYLAYRPLESETSRLSDLSPREFEVFRLLAEGYSVVEIAELLRVSPKTVGHHYTRVKSKLSVPNGARLARLAIQMGVISA